MWGCGGRNWLGFWGGCGVIGGCGRGFRLGYWGGGVCGGFAVEDAADRIHEGVDGNADGGGIVGSGEACDEGFHEAAEGVASGENDIDDGGGDGEVTTARGVEEAFEFVGEEFDGAEADVACAAFEGVECAEDAIEGFAMAGVLFEDEDAFFDILQQVLRFVAELVEQVSVIDGAECHGGFVAEGCGWCGRG